MLINLTINEIRPETSDKTLREVKEILKHAGNNKVTSMIIDGEGSKYLHIFTAPPALTIRVSDHPTGAEGTKNVKDKNHLVAESLKAYLKLK